MKSNQAEPSVPKSLKRIQQNLQRPEINRILALGILAVVVYYFNPLFLSTRNIHLILVWGSIYGIMALGEMLVLLVGGIDLSVGGMISLGSVFNAMLMMEYGLSCWITILATLSVCLGIGFISGYLSTRFSPPLPLMYPAFIFTLSVHFILLGLMQFWTLSLPITPLPKGFAIVGSDVWGVPLPLVYMIVIALVMSFFLYRKPIGWSIYATGQDDEAARVTGVNISKVRIIAFMVSALLFGFGGILISSLSNASSWQAGRGLLMPILTATVVGGVSLAGGEGSPPMAIIGGFLFYIIGNIITVLNISPFYQKAVMGVLLLAFISYDFAQRIR